VGYVISDADRRRWQARDARALVAMLEAGHSAAVPPLRWSLGPHGGLTGNVDPYATVAEQRAAFDAWADLLGATRWPERTTGYGVTHLHALFTWRADDRVKGALRADLFPVEGSEPS
jgi:hypothetical protein